MHSREEELCRRRPREARECAKAHSMFYEISSTAGLTSEKMGVTIVRYEMLYAGDGESL